MLIDPELSRDGPSGGPHDPALPGMAVLVSSYATLDRGLFGGAPLGAPRLVDHLPGHSCTLRFTRRDRVRVDVTIRREGDPRRQAVFDGQMAAALDGRRTAIPAVVGVLADLGAIAHEVPRGPDLHDLLSRAGADPALLCARAVSGLRDLWAMQLTPLVLLDRRALLDASDAAAAALARSGSDDDEAAERLLAWLEGQRPRLPLRPIHGAAGPQRFHIGAEGTMITGTAGMALGPPDLDLASLWLSLMEGAPEEASPAVAAAAALRASAGSSFDWCLGVAALRRAAEASHQGPDGARRARFILGLASRHLVRAGKAKAGDA